MRFVLKTFALLALSAGGLQADILTFSYTMSSGDVLAGKLDGTLQADGNTFVVDGVIQPTTFDGNPGPPLSFVGSVDNFFFGIPFPGAAQVTVDGTFMDFLACDSAGCPNDGYAFLAGDATADIFGSTFVGGPSYGNTQEAFVAADWQASVLVESTPEPDSVLLLLTVLGIAGYLRLQRRPTGSIG